MKNFRLSYLCEWVLTESDYKMHKSRDLYKQINYLAGENKKKERCLKIDDGSLVNSREEIAKRWSEYFDELLNCDEQLM